MCDYGVTLVCTYVCSQLLDHRTKELDQIKLEWNSQTSSLSSRHAREVEVERERALNAQTEAAQRYEADKKALVQSYEDKVLSCRPLCVWREVGRSLSVVYRGKWGGACL